MYRGRSAAASVNERRDGAVALGPDAAHLSLGGLSQCISPPLLLLPRHACGISLISISPQLDLEGVSRPRLGSERVGNAVCRRLDVGVAARGASYGLDGRRALGRRRRRERRRREVVVVARLGRVSARARRSHRGFCGRRLDSRLLGRGGLCVGLCSRVVERAAQLFCLGASRVAFPRGRSGRFCRSLVAGRARVRRGDSREGGSSS